MDHPRLHVLLERLSNVLREDLREVATAHDLKLVQLEALQFLAVANRFSDTLSGLVAYLGATKGTVSQTLSTLEAKGLICRQQDVDDGRVQHCGLTAAGARVAAAGFPAPVLAGLATDAEAAGDVVDGLLRAMLQARGGVAFGVCHTCAHFVPGAGAGAWCGLLQTALSEADSAKWCREHQAA